MNRRIYLLLVIAMIAILPSHAVLKEKNLDNTLSLLRLELTNYRSDLERQSGMMKAQQEQVMMNMISVMNRSRQNSLMLYSQKNGFIFDLTYACHEATEQYQEFQKNVKPFRQYLTSADVEISRYDSLINELGTMGKYGLSEKAKIDRNVCITLAINIRHTLNDNRVQMRDYINIYNQTEERLKYLNTYANTRYKDIQQSIFSNRGDNYISILKNIGHNVVETSETVSEKYKPQKKVQSDWDSRIMLGLLVILALGTGISLLINFVIIRWIARRLTRYSRFEKYRDWLEEKMTCINLAMSVATFAIILGVVRVIVEQNFIIMASGLLINYTWLMEVILLSLMFRLNADKIKSGFKLYSPIMVIGFLVIAFRIALVPNALVSLVFPPILALSIFWQWNAIRNHQQHTEMSDRYYSYASLAVFIFSTISSWVGYTLLAVELLIWWVMQLTCILTITFMQGWLKTYSKNKKMDEKPITQTWIFRFIYKVIMPVLGVLSVMISIYWAADVFNLSDTTWKIFSNYYIDEDGFRASIITIAMSAILYFLFAYLNKTITDQFTTAQAGFQQEHDLGHTICGIGFDRFHLLIAENVLDMLLSGAAVGAVLGRVLIAEVVLNRTFKDCIED